MEKLSPAFPKSKSDCPDKAPNVKKNDDDAKKCRLAIIEECTRKAGVSLSEQMWAQLEKAVDKNWKW